MIRYRLIRSARKTLALEIRDGELIVRAPYRTTQAEIDRMLREKQRWIEQHLDRSLARKAAADSVQPLTRDELEDLARRAVEYIPQRVHYFAPKLGVQVHGITIRNQRTRWGSCSAKGNLNFNCLLMLAPEDVLDYVIVHELCHRKEMNHSKRFYEEVLKAYPDYRIWDKWLNLTALI